MMSTIVQTEFPSVVRTGRGLSIAGTRITLYNIMDYVHAGWAAERIRQWLNLTETQISDVMNYIEQYHDEVEQEYQLVLKQAEENRAYWKAHELEHLKRRNGQPVTPEQAALRAKFEEWKKTRKAV